MDPSVIERFVCNAEVKNISLTHDDDDFDVDDVALCNNVEEEHHLVTFSITNITQQYQKARSFLLKTS